MTARTKRKAGEICVAIIYIGLLFDDSFSMTALVSSQEGSLSDSLLRLPFPEVDFVGGTNPRLFAKGKIIRKPFAVY